MLYRIALSALFYLAFALTAHAAPLLTSQVPEDLQPWVDWVVWDHPERTCPPRHDNPGQRLCLWPTRLALNLDSQGGEFTLDLHLDADTWTVLPGDGEHWPQDVHLDGKPALTASRENRPGLWLAPGRHRLDGRFAWTRLPENLSLPEHAALISLVVNQRPVTIPILDAEHRLWIHHENEDTATALADTLTLRVYRQIADGVPVQVTTHLDLDISGRAREIQLSGAVLADAIPLRIGSELPARLEADGRLRLQARPGHWAIEVESRFPGEIAALPLAEFPAPWPQEEIWVFAAQPEIRLVDIGGAPPVDPRQTELPEAWRELPAYRLSAGGNLAFQTLRRGDPDPEPDSLTLHRTLWLDFDGQGYTLNDRIGGRMTHDWRLNVGPGLDLGRVSLFGEPQSITRDGDNMGVEIRHGQLDLVADSRMGAVRRFAAVGWDQDFREVGYDLNLPPGWRLFSVTGVDTAPGTWTGHWTLLDLFVVLITTLAVARLWGWPWGLFALPTLLLLWQEAEAPRYIWLNLLAATALLRVLPTGRIAHLVAWYRRLSVLVLVLLAVPFMADQIRLGLYPQLQYPWFIQTEETAGNAGLAAPAAPAAEAPMLDMDSGLSSPELNRSLAAPRPAKRAKALSAPEAIGSLDPNAITQTGPGLPRWQWTRVHLGWNGPVVRTQEVGLWLLSPTVNLLLGLLRAVLLLGLGWLIVAGPPRFRRPGGMTPLLILPLLLFLPDAKADFPSPELLDQLRTRLLAAPDCAPACAEIPRLTLRTDATTLTATLDIHAATPVAVPLPAQLGQWLPTDAQVDDQPATGLWRDDEGLLWLRLATGRHRVVLSGPLPQREQVQIPLPLPARRVEATGTHWRVAGIHDNGVPDVQLQLLREATSDTLSLPTLEARPLPPFLDVERTLRLGLEWRVDTLVRRVSSADSAVTVDIPLLPGEAVVTAGLHVHDGKIAVNLLPGQSELAWTSVLAPQPTLTLTAPRTTAWREIWRADVSPIWHLRHDGLVVTHPQNPDGRWLPEWRPWPGESLNLHLSRPVGVPGNTLTIDRADLTLDPGARASTANLELVIRASQGQQHAITLPAGVELQQVAIDNAVQPIRLQGRGVSLPIHPGTQTITLTWRDTTGITAYWQVPALDLGVASVNTKLHINLGMDRWTLLLGGPRLGPAVLFWGELLLMVLLALGLGRWPWTPLKTGAWLLLLVGLSQLPIFGGVLVVGWLLMLAWRERVGAELADWPFKLLQVALALLTLVALLALLEAVRQGLLGLPAMQIAGNGSDAYHLHWYQDRSAASLPRPWVVSVPLWAYRGLMLGWALWLAYSLLDWLRWGYGAYAAGGLWRARPKPADNPTPAHDA